MCLSVTCNTRRCVVCNALYLDMFEHMIDALLREHFPYGNNSLQNQWCLYLLIHPPTHNTVCPVLQAVDTTNGLFIQSHARGDAVSLAGFDERWGGYSLSLYIYHIRTKPRYTPELHIHYF